MSDSQLVEIITDQENSGYYFDTDEILETLNKGLGENFPTQSFINFFENSINNKKVFSQHEFFSKDLQELYKNAPNQMEYMKDSFERELVKIAFIDVDLFENQITLNDSDLNFKIQKYKNRLLENIYKYIIKVNPNYSIEYKELYKEGRYQENTSYKQLLDKLQTLLQDNDLDLSLYDKNSLEILDTFNSAVILANFDSLIDKNFKSILSINQKNYGTLTNPIDNFHYFTEFKGSYTEYWARDSHESSSIENYSSDMIKTIVKTIPLYDAIGRRVDNQYLGMDRLYYIGAVLKTYNKNNSDNFQNNPKQKLKEALEQLQEIKQIEYLGAINSLYEYLYGMDGQIASVIESVKNNNPEIAAKIIDIEALIAHSINNMSPLVYATYSTDKNKIVLDLVQRETKSDEISESIVKHIISNPKNLSKYQIKDSKIYFKGGKELNSFQLRAMISSISGIQITDVIEDLYQITEGALENPIITAFIQLFEASNEVLSALKNAKKDEEIDFKKIITSKKRVNSLLTSVIAAAHPSAVMNFKDSKGNKIPTIGQSNLASETQTSIEIAKNTFGINSDDIFILKNSDIIKGSEIVLEVETGEGFSTEAVYLNPEENLHLNFVENFIKPIIKQKENVSGGKDLNNYLSVKLINFSDKSRIYNLSIDQYLKIGDKSIQEMSLDEIKKLSNDYLHKYYETLLKEVFNTWETLVDSNGKQLVSREKDPLDYINKINKFLSNIWEKDPKNAENNFRKILKDSWVYNKNKGNIVEFVEDVHFSRYSDGLRFNNLLTQYFTQTQKNTLNGIFEDLFIQKLSEIGFSGDLHKLLGFNEKDSYLKSDLIERINLIKQLVNIDLNQWIDVDKQSFIYYKSKNKKTGLITDYDKILSSEELNNIKETYSLELNPLLSKFLHTQNLIRYSYLGVVTKHEYQHPQKAKLSSLNNDFLKEMTSRSIAMTKRMVIYPATMEYFLQGASYSPPEKIKTAIVADTPAISYTFNGVKKKHDSMDGAIHANPFLGYLLKKSLPGKNPKNTQKVIGHSASSVSSTFLKCALFTPTNETIRKSLVSDLSQDKWLQKMNNIDISDIDITYLPNGNSVDFGIITEGLYYKIGNKIQYIRGLEKVSPNQYKVLYTDIVNGKSIPDNKVVTVNNLYDLWQLFGGAFSLKKENNKYSYSEKSIDAVGMLLTMFPELKNRMIGILAQNSAVKNGAFNVNSNDFIKSEFDDELMYGEFDSHFFGVQLDAYHTSDEAMVNEVSQVIAALAQSQSTPEFYKDLYSAIGKIVEKEIQDYKKKFVKKDGNYNIEKITEEFVKYLTSNKQMGNALEIIEALKTGKEMSKLPISNSNFFNQFVISLMSKLKSDFVKRKYPGLAAVLNPSYGTIQLFEDEFGNTFFSEDLLAFAKPEDYPIEENLSINEINKRIIQNVANWKFPNKPITAQEILPLDKLIVNGEFIDLKDIEDYYRVKEELLKDSSIIIERVNNKSRDLKPVEITFTKDGIPYNVFDLDAIKLSFAFRNKKETPEQKIILTNLANSFGIPDYNLNDLTREYLDFKLKGWVQRTFELLGENKIYEPVNVETNFSDYFKADDLFSKLDLTKYEELPLIENYKHKSAEVILPKRYRSEFNLSNDSFSKINQMKDSYFKNKLNRSINPKTKDCDLFLGSSTGESLYISILDSEIFSDSSKMLELGYTPVKVITKEIEGETYRVNIKGEIIYKLPKFKTKSGEKTAEIYTKNGVEFIIFPYKGGFSDDIINFIKGTKESFDVIYPFFANLNVREYENVEELNLNFDTLFDISKKYSKGFIYSDLISSAEYKLGEKDSINYFMNNFPFIKDKLTSTLSKMMYTSWQKSNEVMSARIPSQAMQSFMSMSNKGYIEEEGNDVYVSHIQFMLQGSDLDIDKAYIMMHGFRNGTYKGWSPYFNYTSKENLDFSEQLPIPNKIIYEYNNEVKTNSFLDSFVDILKQNKYLSLEEIVLLLNLVNSQKGHILYKLEVDSETDKIYDRLLKLINRHNSFEYSSDSLKNFVVGNIIKTSNDPKNQVASYSPIDNGKYDKVKEQSENNFTMSIGDGISMDQQQENNSVGKDVIGIAANGIKVYFSLADYFTGYYDGDIKTTDNQYFERDFGIEDKVLGRRVRVNRIAGLKLKETSAKILNTYIARELGIHDLFSSDRDPSLVLSSLLSISTDNAKELILKAINAGTEFASMHIYLITLGFDEGKVAAYMNSKEALNVIKATKWNIFSSTGFRPSVDVIINGKDQIASPEFKKIYNLSKELNFIASVLKINQGLSADAYEIYKYFKNIEQEFIGREIQFFKDTTFAKKSTDKHQTFINRVVADKPYLDSIYISKVLLEAINQGLLTEDYNGGLFSIDKFFENDNYKKAATDYYNLIKGTFNVLDIIEKLDHYREVIKATKMVYDQLKANSSMFKWIVDESPEILKDTVFKSFDSKYKMEGTDRAFYSKEQFGKAVATFGDAVISNFLIDELAITPIDLGELKNMYPDWDIKTFKLSSFVEAKEGDVITFTNPNSLLDFKTLVETNIIPYLKRSFSANDIHNGLVNSFMTRSTSLDRARTWLSTHMKIGKAVDAENGDIMYQYQKGMDALDNEVIVLGKNEFKVTDILYLYNLIVNKDKPGFDRLTKLFGKYISNSNSYAVKFYEYYNKIDSKTKKAFKEDLTNNEKNWIAYSMLNKKGQLKRTNDDESPMKLPNPNIPIAVNMETKFNDPTKMKYFENIKSLIKSKNLLIDFNCE